MTDLLRGDFLGIAGEKVSFIAALKKFFRKKHKNSNILRTYKPFFLVGMKTDPPDIKLASRALLEKIIKVPFSTLKFKDEFRTDLIIFFFLIRKWVECYQILLNSTNLGKDYHPFLLIRISILLKVFEKKKKNKTGKAKKKKESEKFTFKNPVRDFICTGKITEKRKEFAMSRYFLFSVVKTGCFLKIIEGYERLTKTNLSKVVQIEPFSIRICEEIERIEKFLKKILGRNQRKNLKWDCIKRKIIKNSDQLFQKMLIQRKIRRLIF